MRTNYEPPMTTAFFITSKLVWALIRPETWLVIGLALGLLLLDITEDEARGALMHFDPLWDELFPAEQARIVQLLVERVDIGLGGLDVHLRIDGLSGLVREMREAAA